MTVKRFCKANVDTWSSWHESSRPAVNVKAYHFPSADKIAEEFNCSDETAERAGQFAYDSAAGRFWEDAQEEAEHIFGSGVKVYSCGRSGGHLYIEGIDWDVDSWDAISVSRWGRMVKWCQEEIKYLCSWESVKDDISINRWAEDGSEMYNFLEWSGGDDCLVDLKQRAVETLTAANLPAARLLR